MKNKRKVLKIFGVGALCLATAVGFMGCKNNDNTAVYRVSDISADEAYDIYKTAYDKYDLNIDNYWNNLEVNVTVNFDVPTTIKLTRGKVDNVETYVEYVNENRYTIFQVNETDNMTNFYQKQGKNEYLQGTGSVEMVKSDSSFGELYNDNIVSSNFKKAMVDQNGNYILTFAINFNERNEGWDDTKFYIVGYTYELHINSNKKFTQVSYNMALLDYSDNLTGDEIDSIEFNDMSCNFEFNYNNTFNDTLVKGLIEEVENNAK